MNGRGTIFLSPMNGDHHQWVELTHHGIVMKGKRKVKTLKWQNAASLMAQARCRVERRTVRASRFLDVALSLGREFEPVGLLAGGRNPCSLEE